MALKNLFGGKSNRNSERLNQRRRKGGNPEWVLPAALLLGQKLYHSSSNASIGNKRLKKSRKSRKSRKSKRSRNNRKSRRR